MPVSTPDFPQPTSPALPAPVSPWALAATMAAAAPALLAFNVAPSPTFLNQALAFGLWGAFVGLCRPAWPGRGLWPLWAALTLLIAAVFWSWGPGGLPASLALSALGTLVATALLAAGGAGARRGADAAPVFAIFCWAWLIAGLLNVAIALVQVFWPDMADGDWIAVSGIAGRAVGNLRQPNHLSSLLLWSCHRHHRRCCSCRRLRPGAGRAACMVALAIGAVVLTASREPACVSVLPAGGVGRCWTNTWRATRTRACCWPRRCSMRWRGGSACAQWAAAVRDHDLRRPGSAWQEIRHLQLPLRHLGQHAGADPPASPWTGVGFGEFNLAWSMTPFPGRPTAFFDHTPTTCRCSWQRSWACHWPRAVLGLLYWGGCGAAWPPRAAGRRRPGHRVSAVRHVVRADDRRAQPAGVPACGTPTSCCPRPGHGALRCRTARRHPATDRRRPMGAGHGGGLLLVAGSHALGHAGLQRG